MRKYRLVEEDECGNVTPIESRKISLTEGMQIVGIISILLTATGYFINSISRFRK